MIDVSDLTRATDEWPPPIGVVLVPCIVAYFVGSPWQIVFGLVPHYWPLKVFWLFDEAAVGAALVHAVIRAGVGGDRDGAAAPAIRAGGQAMSVHPVSVGLSC